MSLYEEKLRQANALDFDDLLLKTVQLFYKAGEVCEQYNRRFQYVLVDEYQDTNRTQYQLIRQLTLMHQNLCVVGDEDQSIYRWRGADIQNILSFEKDYPNARTVRLEQNYRSTQKILDAAGAVVSRNQARKGKTLWTDRQGGDGIGLYEAWDADRKRCTWRARTAKALPRMRTPAWPFSTAPMPNRACLKNRCAATASPIAWWADSVFTHGRKSATCWLRASWPAIRTDETAFERVINTPGAGGIGPSTVATIESTARDQKISLWHALEEELTVRRLPARALNALQSFHALMKELMAEHEKLLMGQFFKSILDAPVTWKS